MQQMVCAPHYSQMQKCAYKDKATILISDDLGNSHGHGPTLFLSAPISLQVTHQGKSWTPALQRLSPSTLSAFLTSGTLLALPQWDSCPSWSWVPISEQDSCPSQPPTKIWPRHSSTSLIGLLHLLDHSDQHQAEKSWASFCFILKTNACSNSVEWGQGSSLMFKTIIQWLQFFAIRKLQDPRGCFPACCPQGSQMRARQSRFMERSNIFYEPNY